jgi:hypothetical protein
MAKRRNPHAPRIRKDKRTGRWVGRCAPCGYTLSADHWRTNLADVLRHADGASHAGHVALARAATEVTR